MSARFAALQDICPQDPLSDQSDCHIQTEYIDILSAIQDYGPCSERLSNYLGFDTLHTSSDAPLRSRNQDRSCENANQVLPAPHSRERHSIMKPLSRHRYKAGEDTMSFSDFKGSLTAYNGEPVISDMTSPETLSSDTNSYRHIPSPCAHSLFDRPRTARSFLPISALLPRLTAENEDYIPLNQNGDRLDYYIKPPTFEQWNAYTQHVEMHKICNDYQLTGYCYNGPQCQYSHSPLESHFKHILELLIHDCPCSRRGHCRIKGCYLGHICYREGCRTSGKKGECRLDRRMHSIDPIVAYWVPAVQASANGSSDIEPSATERNGVSGELRNSTVGYNLARPPSPRSTSTFFAASDPIRRSFSVTSSSSNIRKRHEDEKSLDKPIRVICGEPAAGLGCHRPLADTSSLRDDHWSNEGKGRKRARGEILSANSSGSVKADRQIAASVESRGPPFASQDRSPSPKDHHTNTARDTVEVTPMTDVVETLRHAVPLLRVVNSPIPHRTIVTEAVAYIGHLESRTATLEQRNSELKAHMQRHLGGSSGHEHLGLLQNEDTLSTHPLRSYF